MGVYQVFVNYHFDIFVLSFSPSILTNLQIKIGDCTKYLSKLSLSHFCFIIFTKYLNKSSNQNRGLYQVFFKTSIVTFLPYLTSILSNKIHKKRGVYQVSYFYQNWYCHISISSIHKNRSRC